MHITRPASINSTWLAAGLVVLSFCAAFISSTSEQQRWLTGAAAISISVLHLLLATFMRPSRVDPVQLIGAMSLLGGIVWSVSGAAMGANLPARRDGAILIVLGCVSAAFPSIQQEPRLWLTCLATSEAAVITGLIIQPNLFSSSGPVWSVSALTGTAALALIAVPFSYLVANQLSNGRARRDTPWAVWLWSIAGVGLLGLALSLVAPDSTSTEWWLPVIAGSMLAIFAMQQATDSTSLPQFDVPRSMSAASLIAIFATSILAAGIVFWLVRETPSRAAHGVVMVAAVSLAVAATALVVYSALHQRIFSALAGTASALLRQSRTDGLTGLPNRRALDERLDAEIQRAARFNHPLTIGMLDIDNFKSVNDTWGHPAGDAVLIAVAARMQQELRTIDVVGRFGGEEFLMILPETDIEGAWIAADRVLRGIRAMTPLSEIEHRTITASVGLAGFPLNGRNAADLIAAADEALYAAKRAGKNQISATPSA